MLTTHARQLKQIVLQINRTHKTDEAQWDCAHFLFLVYSNWSVLKFVKQGIVNLLALMPNIFVPENTQKYTKIFGYTAMVVVFLMQSVVTAPLLLIQVLLTNVAIEVVEQLRIYYKTKNTPQTQDSTAQLHSEEDEEHRKAAKDKPENRLVEILSQDEIAEITEKMGLEVAGRKAEGEDIDELREISIALEQLRIEKREAVPHFSEDATHFSVDPAIPISQRSGDSTQRNSAILTQLQNTTQQKSADKSAYASRVDTAAQESDRSSVSVGRSLNPSPGLGGRTELKVALSVADLVD